MAGDESEEVRVGPEKVFENAEKSAAHVVAVLYFHAAHGPLGSVFRSIEFSDGDRRVVVDGLLLPN